jgi:hypothetical protein
MELTAEQLEALDTIVISFKIGKIQKQLDALKAKKDAEIEIALDDVKTTKHAELDALLESTKLAIEDKYKTDIDALEAEHTTTKAGIAK